MTRTPLDQQSREVARRDRAPGCPGPKKACPAVWSCVPANIHGRISTPTSVGGRSRGPAGA